MRQNKEESWPGQWWQLPEPTVGKSFNSLECCNLVKDMWRHSQGDNCWLCYRYMELLVRLRRSSFEQTKVYNVNWFFGTLYHSQYICSNICIKSKYTTLIEIIGQTSIVAHCCLGYYTLYYTQCGKYAPNGVIIYHVE